MTTYPMQMSDEDFESLITRPRLASGSARDVFEVSSDSTVVVKMVKTTYPGSNMMEWIVWNAVKNTEFKSIFGECFSISNTGCYLLMERLDDIMEQDYADIPDVPVWLNDTKPNAFGRRGTTIKVRDYGLIKFNQLLGNVETTKPAFVADAQVARFHRRRAT